LKPTGKGHASTQPARSVSMGDVELKVPVTNSSIIISDDENDMPLSKRITGLQNGRPNITISRIVNQKSSVKTAVTGSQDEKPKESPIQPKPKAHVILRPMNPNTSAVKPIGQIDANISDKVSQSKSKKTETIKAKPTASNKPISQPKLSETVRANYKPTNTVGQVGKLQNSVSLLNKLPTRASCTSVPILRKLLVKPAEPKLITVEPPPSSTIQLRSNSKSEILKNPAETKSSMPSDVNKQTKPTAVQTEFIHFIPEKVVVKSTATKATTVELRASRIRLVSEAMLVKPLDPAVDTKIKPDHAGNSAKRDAYYNDLLNVRYVCKHFFYMVG
jgi:hypothetical protein